MTPFVFQLRRSCTPCNFFYCKGDVHQSHLLELYDHHHNSQVWSEILKQLHNIFILFYFVRKDKNLANFRTRRCIISWAYVLSYFVVRLRLCSTCMSWMFPCLQHISEKFEQNLLHSGALSTNLSMTLQNQIKKSDWCCTLMWFLCYPTEINCNLGKQISN